MARPSDYTQDLAEEICTRIELGETVAAIAQDDHMPDKATVYRWLAKYRIFRDLYARAREESAHIAADNVLETAEQVRRGELEPDQGRVIIDALKWSAGKRKPKVYGDKIDLTATVSQFDGLTPEQRAALDAACEILLLNRATVIEGEVRAPALIESPKEPPDSESVTR